LITVNTTNNWLFTIFIRYSACSITVSNTTCYCSLSADSVYLYLLYLFQVY
jgi:hypothetical protein